MEKPEIDESLYSRQLYVLGHEAMHKMNSSRVLIISVNGLGIEIAKNICLAGVKSVSLFDKHLVTISDLSSQFFLSEEDIGIARDTASCRHLQELNQYVPVNVADSVTFDYSLIVYCGNNHEERKNLSRKCRENQVLFTCCATSGLFAMAFNDFLTFECIDTNGENPVSGMISDIQKDGTIACLEEHRHSLEDGDYVTFDEVQGMIELNGIQPLKVQVTGPFTFKVAGLESFSNYTGGGYFKQVKQPKTVEFSSFEEAFEKQEFLITDFAKFDRPAQFHQFFKALTDFESKYGFLPRPMDDEDAKNFYKLVSDCDEKLATEFAYQAQGDIPAMNAVIGGMVAQEVLKGCSGKFMPIKQFLYFDSLESLPTNSVRTKENCKPCGTRYDGQIAVFGKEFQNKIGNARQFLVGAGAIGCEMLKNWAMMGLGTGPNGQIIITDMDTIEKSNLNRQFLFRPGDVGKLKSECAVKAVQKMNKLTTNKIKFYAERVGTETENVFGNAFWKELTGVTNALDNVEARKYMDARCVFYGKPLLESGTLGTKGNTQVVIPHLTESYSSSNDPPEKSIPICTLKNFPNAIEHTIQWGRDLFEGLFVQPAENVNLYLSNPGYIDNLLKQGGNHKDIIESILSFLVTERPLTFQECIVWARLKFEELFGNTIKQLLYNFPKDSTTSQGVPFWSGPKRAPDPLNFDAQNPIHMDFIVAAANLHAFNYGLKGERNPASFYKVLDEVMVPEFQPKQGVKIAVVESELNQGNDDVGDLDSIIKKIPHSSKFAGMRLVPCEFEKDDDTNFHIDFVTAASNLRACNYSIAIADRHNTKFIAGKIIPAIATTTALVTGLVCLELYKVIDDRKKLDDYKNGFINLSLPFMAFSEPIPAQKFKYNNTEWTLWDRFNLKGDKTLRDIIDFLQNEHKLEVTMMSCGQTMVYGSFMPKKKKDERMDQPISKIMESILKKPLDDHISTLNIEVCVDDENGEEVDVPTVCLHLKD